MNEMLQQCSDMMSQMGGMMGSMGGNRMGGMMGGGMMAGGMTIASPWYWLGWVLVIAAVVGTVAMAIWVARSLRRGPAMAETPLAMLQRRLAGGEITSQQFAAMRKDLSKG